MPHSTSNPHLLVYPFPGAGHIIPVLDLLHLLLCRGLTITIAISASDIPLLDPILSTYPSSLFKLLLSDLEIKPSSHPVIAEVISTQNQFDPIVRWFKTHPSPPVAIVSDFFLGWTSELASHLGIRRVVFSPSGVLASAIFHTLWQTIEDINGDNCENSLLFFHEIPNSPRFPLWQLPELIRFYKKGEKDSESFRKGMLANLTSWGIVYNTFEGFEGVYIDYMKKKLGHNRVWAVGPLLSDNNGPIATTSRGGSSAVSHNDLLMWLDKKRDDSVVYICFGSQVTLSETQMSALAGALELSNVEFILCTKENDSSSIPCGFQDRVAGRGFIINGWAPQLAILRHRCVGSFVTHCGWNSTLEGVAAGVIMLTWPMGADQFANAKLLVDKLGVGKRVCEGGPKSVPEATELARLLDESVSGDRAERVKVKKMSQTATEAVKQGTSAADLDTFVKLLSDI